MNAASRSTAWIINERENGRCPRCRREHDEINPSTGKRFWRCAFCRKEQREDQKRAYDKRKEASPERKRRAYKRKEEAHQPKPVAMKLSVTPSIYLQPRTIEARYTWAFVAVRP